MSQLRSKTCPACDGPNDGKWTCPSCTEQVNSLRALIRNLQAWHSSYEALEVSDVLVGPDDQSYCLWDIDAVYALRWSLPPRMRQAIEWFLYENVLERDAALRMGLSPSSPVAIYATVGLTKLVAMVFDGDARLCVPSREEQPA